MVTPPKKDIKEDVEEKEAVPEPLQLEEIGPSVRHLVRGINAQGMMGTDGSKPVSIIEDELNSMLRQGYKLLYVQHLRSNFAPEGTQVLSEQMLYVFVQE